MDQALRVLARTVLDVVREWVRPGFEAAVVAEEQEEAVDTDWTADDYTVMGWIALHHRRGVTLEALADYLDRNLRSVSQDVYRLYAAGYVEFTDGLRVRLDREW